MISAESAPEGRRRGARVEIFQVPRILGVSKISLAVLRLESMVKMKEVDVMLSRHKPIV